MLADIVKSSRHPAFSMYVHNPKDDRFNSATILRRHRYEEKHINAVLDALGERRDEAL